MRKLQPESGDRKSLRVVVPVEIPASALTIVAAPPSLVTQANVEAVCGFSRGVYLSDLLPAYEAAGGRVSRVGKTRAVEREAFVSWLMSRTAPSRSDDAAPVDEDAALAAELGLRVAGGRR